MVGIGHVNVVDLFEKSLLCIGLHGQTRGCGKDVRDRVARQIPQASYAKGDWRRRISPDTSTRNRGLPVTRYKRIGFSNIMFGVTHGAKNLVCEPLSSDMTECASQSTRHPRVTSLQQTMNQFRDLAHRRQCRLRLNGVIPKKALWHAHEGRVGRKQAQAILEAEIVWCRGPRTSEIEQRCLERQVDPMVSRIDSMYDDLVRHR